jgi:hypothetical protein
MEPDPWQSPGVPLLFAAKVGLFDPPRENKFNYLASIAVENNEGG